MDAARLTTGRIFLLKYNQIHDASGPEWGTGRLTI